MTDRSRRDIPLLFTTRLIRMFGYGFLSVVLALYLAQRGLSEGEIGLLLTLTLAGDAAITLWITTSADRMGRRRMKAVYRLPQRDSRRRRSGHLTVAPPGT
jgi:MFS family permease